MGLVGGVSWGGMMRCSLLFAARRGAALLYAGRLFGPLPSRWGVMVGPPRPSRCCRCCSLRSVRWCAEIVAPLVRRARTLVAVRRRARARLRARLRFGRDVGGTMFGSPRGRHDAAVHFGCRGRGADVVALLLQRSRALVVVKVRIQPRMVPIGTDQHHRISSGKLFDRPPFVGKKGVRNR